MPDRSRKPLNDVLVGVGNLAAVLLLYFVTPVSATEHDWLLVVQLGVAIGALGLAIFFVARGVAHAGKVRGGLAFVLVLETVLVAFAFAYYIVDQRRPGEFSGIDTKLDALYFTVTVIATVGFGDIVATGQFGRALVTANMLFNLAFLAALTGLIRAHRQAAYTLTTGREAGPDTKPRSETG